ncbi:N-acetylmuramoyl-L-alanine amidase [Alicyclobacillaceae bacterium I2511]|nr:N-acetylmuramoyl-L-alanine amidase [Alicyclobacillaceae bacterium I2511]
MIAKMWWIVAMFCCVTGIQQQPVVWAQTTVKTASVAQKVISQGEAIQKFNQPFDSGSKGDSPTPNGLYGKVIVFDAGHVGVDGGAAGVAGVQEKDINLAVCQRTAHLLRQAGAFVVMTRDTDEDLASDADVRLHRRHHQDLRNRVRLIQEKNAAAFVSIHCNAIANPTWRGAETLYMKGNFAGERLAKLMQVHFRQDLLPTRREANEVSNLYILKHIQGPAVLAEIGFITNPEEGSALRSQTYQQRVAFSIYTSLVEYFNSPVFEAGGLATGIE